MADIARYPFLRHLRSGPTGFVVHSRDGRVRHATAAAAFWFRPLSAAISEVPVDDRDLTLVTHARTRDLQDVSVAATVSFRFADPVTVASRVDFGINPETGAWIGNPLEQVSQLLTASATTLAVEAVATLTTVEAVSGGVGALSAAMTSGLQADPRLATTGISVLGAQVRSVRADADLERALQTPAREATQTEADAATSQRRALAVERERTIAETELANRIELAAREQELVAQEGANARRRAEESAAAALVEATAAAEREALRAQATAASTREIGEAEAAAEAARVAVYADVDPALLTALTLQQFAGNLPDIGQLMITPDLLTRVLAGVGVGRE